MFDEELALTPNDVDEAEPVDLPEAQAQIVPALIRVSKLSRALFGIQLGSIGLQNGQDEMILALNEEEPVPVTRLAERLAVRPSTVSKMLDRLITKGLVQRSGDERDARRTLISVTPQGLDARSAILKLRETIEADLGRTVPANEQQRVAGELSAIAKTLEERLARLR